jgi:hypothetical protein
MLQVSSANGMSAGAVDPWIVLGGWVLAMLLIAAAVVWADRLPSSRQVQGPAGTSRAQAGRRRPLGGDVLHQVGPRGRPLPGPADSPVQTGADSCTVAAGLVAVGQRSTTAEPR